jgi:nucleotide-binding universal stress UspA family protein
MTDTWLVAFDDQPHAQLALDEAGRGLSEGGRVIGLHVLPRLKDAALEEELTDAATAALNARWSEGERGAASFEPRVVAGGRVVDEIVVAAEDAGAELIAVGARGPHKLGLIVESVLRRAHCPVLVVRAPDDSSRPTFPPKRAVVAVALEHDRPSLDGRTLEAAGALAAQYGTELELVHVLAPGPTVVWTDPAARVSMAVSEAREAAIEGAKAELHELAQTARAKGATVLERVIGDATRVEDGVAQAARDFSADLVVISTHARQGLDRLFLGSVARRVARDAPVSVMAVPPA